MKRLTKMWLHLRLATVLPVLFMAGCSTVNPAPDYQRAGEAVRERTGGSDVYDPSAEDLIESKVAALLADGLTAQEAVSVALLNNRDFQGLFYEIGVSRAEVVQSGLLTNPTLVFNALIPNGGGRTKLTYGVAQEIADLWQIPKRKKAAKERLESTILNVARSATDIAMRTKVAYYSSLATDLAASNAQDNKRLAEQSLALVQKRFDAGDVSQLDVNRANSSLLVASTNHLAAMQQAKASRATLNSVLGLSYLEGDWFLSDSLVVEPISLADDETLIMAAADNLLEVQMAERDVLAAESELSAQYRAIFPGIKLGVSAERTAQRAIPGRAEQGLAAWKPGQAVVSAAPNLRSQRIAGPNPLTTAQAINSGGPVVPALVNQGIASAKRLNTIRGLLPLFPTQRQRNLAESQQIDFLWGPTLQVTLPIWDQNQAHIAVARFRLMQKQKAYEQVLEVLAESIITKASKLRTAQQVASHFANEALPLAEEIVKGTGLVYEAGEEGVLSVIEAQRTLTDLQNAHVQALLDYNVARAELEQALNLALAPDEVHRIEDDDAA